MGSFDDRLRALKRRYQETGAAEDEAAWMRERVRAGELMAERVVFAARLGHPPARVFVDLEAEQDPEDLNLWVESLVLPGEVEDVAFSPSPDFVRQACVRIGLACAWLVGDLRRLWYRPAEAQALHAAEDWAVCPCPPHALEASTSAARATWVEEYPGLRVSTVAGLVAELVGSGDPRYTGLLAGTCLQRAGQTVGRRHGVAEAVREAVLPWALELGDPVQERIDRRGS